MIRRGFAAAVVFSLAATVLNAGDRIACERASALYERTDYSGAVHLLRQCPQDAPNIELLGRALFMNDDLRSAAETLERAVALNPQSSSAFLWLGRAYGRRAEAAFPLAALNLATRARQSFEKAVQLDPSNREAINDLFEFYLEAPGVIGGGLDKAEKLLPAIARQDEAESHFASARLAEKRKQIPTAESQLHRAIEAAPREPGRVLDLAGFLSRHGRYEESEKVFQQAEKIAPNSPKVWFARAAAYVRAKRNVAQAQALLKKYVSATNRTPDDPPLSEAMKLLKTAEGS